MWHDDIRGIPNLLYLEVSGTQMVDSALHNLECVCWIPAPLAVSHGEHHRED